MLCFTPFSMGLKVSLKLKRKIDTLFFLILRNLLKNLMYGVINYQENPTALYTRPYTSLLVHPGCSNSLAIVSGFHIPQKNKQEPCGSEQ